MYKLVLLLFILTAATCGVFYLYDRPADPLAPFIPEGNCFVDDESEMLVRRPQKLFRGTDNKQISAENMIQIMLGISEQVIPSKLYSYLNNIIQTGDSNITLNKNQSFSRLLAKAKVISESFLDKNIDASDEIRDLLTEYFGSIDSTVFTETYLDYASKLRNDVPSDIVFATSNYSLAPIYGSFTLHLNNSDSRLINMWRWNLSNCNSHTHFADIGEVLYPGYIKASSLEGFDYRREYPHDFWWKYRLYEPSKIIIHFSKLKINNDYFVAAFSGRISGQSDQMTCFLNNKPCKIKTLDGKIEYLDQKPLLLGIFTTKSNDSLREICRYKLKFNPSAANQEEKILLDDLSQKLSLKVKFQYWDKSCPNLAQ